MLCPREGTLVALGARAAGPVEKPEPDVVGSEILAETFEERDSVLRQELLDDADFLGHRTTPS
jgi:hypothetical protein